jgi:ABC-type glutathione transport system ATPase component
MEDVILEAQCLTKEYVRSRRGKRERFSALNQVSFQLRRGEILGVLGESGSGKTTLARCLVGACPFDGTLSSSGQTLHLEDPAARRAWRKKIQLVFQDSYSAFDSRKTLGYSLREVLPLRRDYAPQQETEILESALREVSLDPALLSRCPGELSGGQCQRLNIVRALLLDPEILILDEPVSALDTTIQMQLLELLAKLRAERNLTYLFISHDLPVIHFLCDRVLVFHQGEIVEEGDARRVLESPRHAYTKSLLNAVPAARPD